MGYILALCPPPVPSLWKLTDRFHVWRAMTTPTPTHPYLPYLPYGLTPPSLVLRQVRHGIYNRSVGGWRRYADHLGTLKKAYTSHLPRLRELKALPYEERINWGGDVKFDYEGVLTAVVTGDSGLISGNQLQQRQQQQQPPHVGGSVEMGMDGNVVLPVPPVDQNSNSMDKKKTKKPKKKKSKQTQGKK